MAVFQTSESGVTICVGGNSITVTIIETRQRPTVLDGHFESTKHSPDQMVWQVPIRNRPLPDHSTHCLINQMLKVLWSTSTPGPIVVDRETFLRY